MSSLNEAIAIALITFGLIFKSFFLHANARYSCLVPVRFIVRY